MNAFDPGDGWRRANPDSDYVQLVEYDARGATAIGWWVREEPVPPLPTVPYTVIRTRVGARDDFFMKMPSLIWRCLGNEQAAHTDESLRREMTPGRGFEVLSEPRFVTAKAVLDHIASEPWARHVDLQHWREVFGVTTTTGDH